MSLAVVLLSLLADDLFVIGKAQLCEAIAGVEVLLVIAVYILLFLRGRLPIYISKSAYTFVCNKARGRVEKTNRLVYLLVPLYHTAALF
jgi:hypothetical protein